MGIGLVLLAVIVAVVAAEAWLQLRGHADIPLFEPSPTLGYFHKPLQSGRYLNRHAWAFNELSMVGVQPFTGGGTLLIGDSLVDGGIPDDKLRLSSHLEKCLGEPVWAVGAGGWALQNELAYLAQHPDVVARVRQVVFILNSGDFAGPSSWTHDINHPRTRPFPVLARFVWRRLQSRVPPLKPPVPVEPTDDLRRDFEAFVAGAGRPVRVITFPTRAEFAAGRKMKPDWLSVTLHVGDDPRWKAEFYADHIHPTQAAMPVLAAILAEALA